MFNDSLTCEIPHELNILLIDWERVITVDKLVLCFSVLQCKVQTHTFSIDEKCPTDEQPIIVYSTLKLYLNIQREADEGVDQ